MTVQIINDDCRNALKAMPDASVNCIVTSPPYFGLRDYGMAKQIGLEKTPDDFVAQLVSVFREARRVLSDDGTLWLNLGDSYSFSGKGGNPAESPYKKQATNAGSLIKGGNMGSGLPPKNLIGIPWRVAFALQADGWYLRQDIIWSKPNPMPESVKDRCTKAHEYLFLLSKAPRYFYDADAIKEPFSDERMGNPNGGGNYAVAAFGDSPQKGLSKGEWNVDGDIKGRNRRSVWTITSKPFEGAHFATFPPDLIEPCILAGCPKGGTVLDPFGGAGTTGMVADRLGRNAVLIELNPEYADMARNRIAQDAGMFAGVELTREARAA